MNWNDHKAIYLQIVDRIIDEVLMEQVKAGDRALSVRELAAQVQVNPNTVVRSYGLLEREGILYNQRGLGFYIAENALEKARSLKRKTFIEETLPEVFKTMNLLQISLQDLHSFHLQFQNINS
ncbi:GntR family transcriptional regulator [Haliscomenobacter hydrossis]|uniref:Transcriptional regulator, GntR family n=1 Tax=Haliscomenobacter hydrossis (strain ATCC 27775 / DSM 1100 / LMG 10767 / O) TaxID=760192 RepID=F4L1B7_HALH1|nr:GntR family transcriptional regulator [Haliscomenobacter hydrossis]AEE53814.1 transcriptional regulator, GntR family [Haliscomenobacter hydrossis DSM 1100]